MRTEERQSQKKQRRPNKAESRQLNKIRHAFCRKSMKVKKCPYGCGRDRHNDVGFDKRIKPASKPVTGNKIVRKKHGHRQWQRPPEKKDRQRHHRARQLKYIRHHTDAFDDLAIRADRGTEGQTEWRKRERIWPKSASTCPSLPDFRGTHGSILSRKGYRQST